MQHRRCGAPKKAAAALLFFFLAAGAAFGQDPGAGPGTPRRVLLLVTQADGAGYDADGLSIVSRSVLLGLQTDPEVRAAWTIIVGPPAQGTSGSDDARTAAARAAGADAWLWIEVSRSAKRADLRVLSFDIARQSRPIDRTMVMESGLSLLDLPAADWSGVARLVAQAYLPLRAGSEGLLPAAPTAARLSIQARPGSIVGIAGGQEVTTGADGTAVMTLAIPAEYTLRATAPGFSPATLRLYMTADRDVTLRQVPGAHWSVEASLADIAFPGVSLSWFAVPDSVFIGVGATTYSFGLALNNTDVFLSLPLTNVSLKMGFYMTPGDSPFRIYVGFTQFLRIVHAPVYFGLDPLAPAGTQLVLGAEIARTPGGGFFVEYVPTMYLTSLPNVFRAALGVSDTPRGWSFASDLALNFLTFRVGYRWML